MVRPFGPALDPALFPLDFEVLADAPGAEVQGLGDLAAITGAMHLQVGQDALEVRRGPAGHHIPIHVRILSKRYIDSNNNTIAIIAIIISYLSRQCFSSMRPPLAKQRVHDGPGARKGSLLGSCPALLNRLQARRQVEQLLSPEEVLYGVELLLHLEHGSGKGEYTADTQLCERLRGGHVQVLERNALLC